MVKITLRKFIISSAFLGLVIFVSKSALSSKIFRPFIIGGVEVEPNDPVALITVTVFNNNNGNLCSGSILTDDVVVTAAHCTSESPSDLFIVFKVDVNDLVDEDLRLVEKQIVHHGFKREQGGQKNTNDIALVKIKGKIPSAYHEATRLAVDDDLKINDTVLLAGYGISNARDAGGTSGILRKVDGIRIDNPKFSESEVLLDQRQGKGACHGDSGGPAYLTTSNGELLLWGVTSRGYPDDAPDDCAHGVIYTSLNAHEEWIRNSILQLQ